MPISIDTIPGGRRRSAPASALPDDPVVPDYLLSAREVVARIQRAPTLHADNRRFPSCRVDGVVFPVDDRDVSVEPTRIPFLGEPHRLAGPWKAVDHLLESTFRSGRLV
jgi:hypothetical protein